MKELHIDIETYSEVNLAKCGVYKYAAHKSFQIILFAYSWDNEEPTVVDLITDGPYLPDDVYYALTDPNIKKIAHNAAFEITCISAYFELELDAAQWFCTMIGAAYLGLPLGLDQVSKVLHLSEQKDSRGKQLIKYFCEPCKPTKTNGGRTRNMPSHAWDKWQEFIEYNAQDVRAEIEILEYLNKLPAMPPIEWAYWVQDQKINRRGIMLDKEFIKAAIEADEAAIDAVRTELRQLTGLDNPNSVAQLKAWIAENTGGQVPASLSKEHIEDALKANTLPLKVKRVYQLRAMANKTSTKKYTAMLNYMGADRRARGIIQFYGANRTGRYAGRGIQPQNMTRNPSNGLEDMRDAVLTKCAELLYDDISSVVSQLIRTAIIAPEGRSLVSCDFSAIEGRVLAWLSGEAWKLDVFRTHGKIYEATAARMFNIDISEVTKDSHWRQKGKVAELALGYQGAAGALITMGAIRQGLKEEELKPIVYAWRAANPTIVSLWRKVENAAKACVEQRRTITLGLPSCKLVFTYDRGYMFITLPSGRRLSYYGAGVSKAARNQLYYFGMDQVKKIWTRIPTYGGMLVENITQAVARDCLTDAMYRLDSHDLIMHVHDEIVGEAPDAEAPDLLKAMQEVMSVPPVWASDLPIKGEGYVSKFYKKD